MHRTIGLILVLANIFLLLNCTKNFLPPKDTIVSAISSPPSTLDPRFATGATEQRINGLLFNSLVKIGPQLDVVGDAAESWRIVDSDFIFVLKPNIMFTNGRALTAEDIKYSLKQFKRKDCPFHKGFEAVTGLSVQSVKGKFVIRFFLSKYSAKMLSSDWPLFKILPKDELESQPEQFKAHPFGTGSYKLVGLNASSVTLERFEAHSFAKAVAHKIVFKVVRDEFTRFMKMYKGELDVVQSDLPLNKISSFKAQPEKFQVIEYPGLSFSYILINHKHPLLKYKAVRQALSLAIDREKIVKYKLEGYGQPAASILTPGNPYFDKSLVPIQFDLKKARRILDKLNLPAFALTLDSSNGNSAISIGRVLSHQLSQLGIKLSLSTSEWGTFYEKIKKGQFSLATMRWVGAIDPDIYRVALHSHEIPPGRNRGFYQNKTLDKLLEAGLDQKNKDYRINIYKKIQNIVTDDLAIIPLWYNQQVVVINKRLKNYEPALNGDFSPLIKAFKP